MAIKLGNCTDNSCFSSIVFFFAVMIILAMVQYVLTEDFTMIAFGIVSDTDAGSLSKTPINHVIVISQGERSFDNYFGTFPGASGFPANLEVPLNPFPPSALEFTVGAWFNSNSTLLENGFLVNKGGIGVDTPGKNMNYGIWMNKMGNIISGFETNDGVDYVVGSNATHNDGEWHNVVVTYDGNSALKLFIDGALTSENKTGGAIPDVNSVQPIRIGSNSFVPDNYFTGLVDEVRIWNRTLDHSEILTGYTSNTFDTNGQLVYLSFDNNQHINPISNQTTSSHQLDGIYLNGSSYHDVETGSLRYSTHIKPFSLEQTKTDAPEEGSETYKTSYNGGQMNGFLYAQNLKGKDPNLVMGYYDSKQLPYYWQFASEFVLADNFFAPSMGTGLANHQYLYTATSVDYPKGNSFRGFINLNRTIFDELQVNGYPWRVYVEDYDPALNYTNDDTRKNRYINLLPAIPRFVDNKTLNSNIVDLVEYFRDLQSDNFPAVSYIVAPNSDETSPRDIYAGQEFVTSLVLALMKSKHWNDSVFILTYRESGGWYDHVKPPIVNGERYGFRVPTVIISPFAKKGYVDSTIYDVTSILKFVEYNYGLSPLSIRDAYANNLLNAFDFTQPLTKPLVLNSSGVENAIQDNWKKIHTNGESKEKVHLMYLIILLLIPPIALIIWWSGRRRNTKLDFARDRF